MNILIANDDGPEAAGIKVLRRAAEIVHPNARIVSLMPKTGVGGKGLSITPGEQELTLQRLTPHEYVCDGTPAHLIYFALGSPRRFLPQGQFDLVLTGLNHGENVGMDVFHSGTVGMAMLASGYFGVPAFAFSQQMSDEPMQDHLFRTATEWLPILLALPQLRNGRCWNINFPVQPAEGCRLCHVSMYSYSRFRADLHVHNKHAGGDVAELERGYVTCVLLRPEARFHGTLPPPGTLHRVSLKPHLGQEGASR